MDQKTQYKIGTRGSLLAITQCQLTKEQIESNSPLHSFTLQQIKTQGDQVTDRPLWQMEGKDFFTKELDEALLSKEVDLVVHSYKDLGTDRPDDISLACVPERTFPHDILLIKNTTIDRLKSLDKLIIGTSSPRRIQNVESGLADYLPLFEGQITTKMLRGNVNTRIEKLQRGEYDGIVIAFAGLERLCSRNDSLEVLETLTQGLNFMILPCKDFPPAASQGALAIEVHQQNHALGKLLQSHSHLETQQEVAKERAAFREYGGGCHLAVGIYVKRHLGFYLHFHKGVADGQCIDHKKLEGFDYSDLKEKRVYFNYGEADFILQKKAIHNPSQHGHLFVTSTHCLHNIDKYKSLWSAGNRTMKKMAQKGFWVQGSAEGLGHDYMQSLRNSKFVNLILPQDNWLTLSHNRAQAGEGEIIACYRHEKNDNYQEKQLQELLQADIVYWSSSIQFDTYCELWPALMEKRHACGLGKTYLALKAKGIPVIPCIDMHHLKVLTKGTSL